jgi:hypothetical protein
MITEYGGRSGVSLTVLPSQAAASSLSSSRSRGRVKESDPVATRPDADAGLDQLGSLAARACNCLIEIGHTETQVVKPGTPLCYETGDRRGRVGRLEQLYAAGPLAKESHAHPFALDLLRSRDLLPQDGLEERYGLVQRVDRDSDVVDYGHRQLCSRVKRRRRGRCRATCHGMERTFRRWQRILEGASFLATP